MLRMVSYPHRPQSGHIMCYLNRTYHVLPTRKFLKLDSRDASEENARCLNSRSIRSVGLAQNEPGRG
jgi:hypothetical protein